MFPPFPESQAYEVCKSIISDINSKKINVQLLCDPKCERASQGFMIGALVCKQMRSDQSGVGEKEVLLKTVSGMIYKLCSAAGYDTERIYVESIVSSEKINEAVKKNDDEIHALTKKIEALKKNAAYSKNTANNDEALEEELHALMAARSKLTDESLEKVYALYSFHCAKVPCGPQDKTVAVRSLKEICLERNKGNLPPTGTGDCCAPKLLDYCFAHQ